MSAQLGRRQGSPRVERVKGAVAVFTPCHGARVLFPPDEAVPQTELSVVCPRDGIERHLTLVVDKTAEGGLRAVWGAAG